MFEWGGRKASNIKGYKDMSLQQIRNRLMPLKKGTSRRMFQDMLSSSVLCEDTKKKARKKGAVMNSSLKLEILDMIFVQDRHQNEIAKACKVSEQAVSHIKKKYCTDGDKLEHLINDEVAEASLVEVVEDVVGIFKAEDKPIRSMKQIATIANQFQKKEVGHDRLRQVLKAECNLSFKGVKTHKDDFNLREYKFKRHYFSRFFLDKMGQGWRCINFDESHINELNFCNKAWSRRGKVYRMENKAVVPRVTMVAAVDNLGNKYLSLHQSNSNQRTTQLMLW